MKNPVLSVCLASLTGLLLVGCSDFGQPMGLPAKQEKSEEEFVTYSENTEPTAQGEPEATPNTASSSEANQKVMTAREILNERPTPWTSIVALSDRVTLGIDGEVDLRNLLVGCESAPDIHKWVKATSDEVMAATPKKFGIFPASFPQSVHAMPIQLARQSNQQLGINCALQQTWTIKGQAAFGTMDQTHALRQVVVVEESQLQNSSVAYGWINKKVEVTRDVPLDRFVIRVTSVEASGFKQETEVKLEVKKNVDRNDEASWRKEFQISITGLVQRAGSPGLAGLAETKRHSGSPIVLSASVSEAINENGVADKSFRYRRSIEPIPEPWGSEEDEFIRSLLSMIHHLNGFDI